MWVPFGTRIAQGIVIELSDHPSVEVTKEINSPITSYPLLSSIQIELARWISQYYFSPLFDAIALMLPPAFERKLVTCFQLTTPQESLPSLTSEQTQVLRLIEQKGKVSLRQLEKKFGGLKPDLGAVVVS